MAWKYDDDTKTIAGLPSSVETATQIIEREKRQQGPDLAGKYEDIDPSDQFLGLDQQETISVEVAHSVLNLAKSLNSLTEAAQEQNAIIRQLAESIKENRSEIKAHTQILVDLFDTSPEIGRRIRFAQELREQGDDLAKEEE